MFFAAWTRAYIELQDSFRDDETSELREVQRELESTSKNCRILQFKLRKTERRCDQLESERADYEEKVTATEALVTRIYATRDLRGGQKLPPITVFLSC